MSQIGFEQAAADHGIDLDALKTLTPGTTGITPQAAIANAGAAPTQAQFNALLQALRDAGVIAAA